MNQFTKYVNSTPMQCSHCGIPMYFASSDWYHVYPDGTKSIWPGKCGAAAGAVYLIEPTKPIKSVIKIRPSVMCPRTGFVCESAVLCVSKEECQEQPLPNVSQAGSAQPGDAPTEPWPDERLHEYIWTQIEEQGGTGNLLKPDGVSDARFDRLVNEIAKPLHAL